MIQPWHYLLVDLMPLLSLSETIQSEDNLPMNMSPEDDIFTRTGVKLDNNPA